MAQHTGREWVFTINAKDTKNEQVACIQLKPIYEQLKKVEATYLVVKGECGESGNFHLQGYVMFASTLTRNQVKALFGCSWMWLEKRAKDSTPSLAQRYVMKEETSWASFPLVEIGTLPGTAISAHAKKSRYREEILQMISSRNLTSMEDLENELKSETISWLASRMP